MRRWKILFGLALAVLALVGALAIWVQSVAARRWAEMEEFVRALRRNTEARRGERPVLRGEAEPGDAWNDYVRAAEGLGVVDGFHAGLSDVYSWVQGSEADRSNAIAFIESQGTTLEALRRGARRSHGQACVDWGRGSGSADRRTLRLLQLAEGRLRLDVERGDAAAVLDLSLDLAQVGGDIARNGDLFAGLEGINFLQVAFQGIKDQLQAGRMAAKEAARLGEALDRLDASFPDLAQIGVNESMAMGTKLLEATSLSEFRRVWAHPHEEALTSWLKRVLLPDRLLMAEAFFFEWDLRQRELAALELPWPASREEFHKLPEEVVYPGVSVTEPVHGSLSRTLSSLPEHFHRCRAQLRLLRASAHFLATGATPDLPDPFGTRLLFRELQDGRLRVWSVGPDGVDHGGDSAGEAPWKPAPHKTESRDLVLEVGPKR